MTQYLVAIHHPDDFEPYSEPDQRRRDISALNVEMREKGVIVFVGGLDRPQKAKSLRPTSLKAAPSGGIEMTDGPYIEAKEHIGGFWVLECASEAEALEWGRKAVIACQTPVEVRAFN